MFVCAASGVVTSAPSAPFGPAYGDAAPCPWICMIDIGGRLTDSTIDVVPVRASASVIVTGSVFAPLAVSARPSR